MGFRELVEGSMIIDHPTSVDSQIREVSKPTEMPLLCSII